MDADSAAAAAIATTTKTEPCVRMLAAFDAS